MESDHPSSEPLSRWTGPLRRHPGLWVALVFAALLALTQWPMLKGLFYRFGGPARMTASAGAPISRRRWRRRGNRISPCSWISPQAGARPARR